MIQFKKLFFEKGIFLLLLFLACYLALRVFCVGITIDEASTFFSVTYLNFGEVLSFKISSANNHWLNSIFVYLLTKTFADDVVLMRLPNFFAGLLYMYYCYKILGVLSPKKWFVFLGLILFCFHSYLLDFFGLARGYGLSYGFMMASVYYLLSYIKGNTKQLTWSFLFCALAIFSSFILLNYLMALISVVVLNIVLNRPKSYANLKAPVLISITTFILIAKPLYLLKTGNELYFGGANGFWKDTVESLFRFMMYRGYATNYPTEFDLINWIKIVVPILIIVAFYFNKNKTEEKKLIIAALLLLAIPALSTVAQHAVLNTNFLFQRTGLFLFPLLIFFTITALASIAKVRAVPAALIMIVLATGSIIHFAKTANISTTMEWNFNTDDVNVLNNLQTLHDFQTSHDTISLMVDPIHEATFSFYKQTKKLDWLHLVYLKDQPKNTEYIYLYEPFLPQIDTTSYTTIKNYKASECVLLKLDSLY